MKLNIFIIGLIICSSLLIANNKIEKYKVKLVSKGETILESNDMGKSWNKVDSKTNQTVFTSKMESSNGKTYYSYDNGKTWYKFDSQNSSTIKLLNLYPNPVNNNSVIELQLENDSEFEFIILHYSGVVASRFTKHLKKGVNYEYYNFNILQTGFYYLTIKDRKTEFEKTFSFYKN